MSFRAATLSELRESIMAAVMLSRSLSSDMYISLYAIEW